MGTLDGLLRIKEFREGKAEREVMRAKLALDAAHVALERAHAALNGYLDQCQQREDALYRDLLSRIVHKSDLDDVEAEIKLMREEVPVYQKAIDDAGQVLADAEQALVDARIALQEAIRMREKFAELVAIEGREHAIEALRLEDMEMEEVKLKSRADSGYDDIDAALEISQ
jgi:hypothetical protein